MTAAYRPTASRRRRIGHVSGIKIALQLLYHIIPISERGQIKMQYIIAAEPKDIKNAFSFKKPLAHMAYKIGADARLYRAEGSDTTEGGYMILSADGEIHSDDHTVTEIVNECKERHFSGVFANFGASPLLTSLSKALSEQNLRMIVPEPLGNDFKNAWVLISSALSGGSLRRRLSEAANTYGAGRIVLDVERVFRVFTPPVPDGQGRPLSREEYETLKARVSPTPFFSYDLCCNYFIFFEDEQPHIVLYDNVGSIKSKLLIASSLRIDKAMFLYSETYDIMLNL